MRDDPVLHNPAVDALFSHIAPYRQDKEALRRLISRYGEVITLGEALRQVQAVFDEVGAAYRAIKARGETL